MVLFFGEKMKKFLKNKKALLIVATLFITINQQNYASELPTMPATFNESNYTQLLDQAYSDLVSKVSTSECQSGCACASKKQREESPEYAKQLGYSEDEVELAKKLGIVICLGCGSPVSVVDLKEGEVGIDLGSGGGFDAFLAGKIIGPTGKVIGIDRNDRMIRVANEKRELAKREGIVNVEFIKGELEALPLPDGFADVAWSNCVFNLAQDKQKAFHEVFRVLRAGGRFIYSDVIALGKMTKEMQQSTAMQTFCIARATPIEELRVMLETAGFTRVRIMEKDSRAYLDHWTTGTGVEAEAAEKVRSAYIFAYKPSEK